ncbi:LexA family protein [Leeia sp.]|uniref:LexA family protein n=1 Tax=Leeia sp. TaxID=2884678 RepID=UPI0035B3B8A5
MNHTTAIPCASATLQPGPQARPLSGCRMPAGFPSPAEDWAEAALDLNRHFVTHPESTFFFRVSGQSMAGPDPARGFPESAILIVDRSRTARHDDVVVAVVDGAFTVKRLSRRAGQVQLLAENPAWPVLTLVAEQELLIWGVVTAWVVEA